MIVFRTRLRRLLAASAILVAAGAAPARGDSCGDCSPPPDSEFRAAMGGQFDDSGSSPDYYEYEGGDCEVSIGPVAWTLEGTERLPVGRGEAQHCPSGTGISFVDYTLSLTSEYEWTLTSGPSGELGKALVAKMAAGAADAKCPASGTPTATTIKQTVSATWCHRAPWGAYFDVATYTASADFTITRQFTWWVKNAQSGDAVLASGVIDALCQSGTATMKRKWPTDAGVIVGSIACSESPCSTDPNASQHYGGDGDAPAPTGTDSGSDGADATSPTAPSSGDTSGGTGTTATGDTVAVGDAATSGRCDAATGSRS